MKNRRRERGILNGESCPRLSKEEEIAAWERMRAGCPQAKDELARSVLPWIARLATQWLLSNEDLEELISLGNVALARALNAFDPHRARLTTYVAMCFKNALIAWRLSLLMDKRRVHSLCVNMQGRDHTDLDWIAWFVEERDFDAAARSVALAEAIENLPERDRKIIQRRLAGQTFKEIASAFGVSKARVQQIEDRATRQLRRCLVPISPEVQVA